MAADLDYALMAGNVYRTTRHPNNWIPSPESGWGEGPSITDPASGLVARTYTGGNGNEIVISFAGTGGAFNIDWFANIGLTLGFWSEQFQQAALFYAEVKKNNAGATITLTGHSLGGVVD